MLLPKKCYIQVLYSHPKSRTLAKKPCSHLMHAAKKPQVSFNQKGKSFKQKMSMIPSLLISFSLELELTLKKTKNSLYLIKASSDISFPKYRRLFIGFFWVKLMHVSKKRFERDVSLSFVALFFRSYYMKLPEAVINKKMLMLLYKMLNKRIRAVKNRSYIQATQR